MIYEVQNTFSLDFDAETLKRAAAKSLGVETDAIESVSLIKKSVDARKKPDIKIVCSLAVSVRGKVCGKIYTPPAADVGQYLESVGAPKARGEVAVIGSGPAGLFAALTLALCGVKPVIFERGSAADERVKKVAAFNATGRLDPDCNVQFGEGGAGTFSDGKLNTGVGSASVPAILGEFVKNGAPEDIRYSSKPHIGTDVLATVVKNLRKKIESLGGTYYFDTKVTDFYEKDGKINLLFEGAQSGGRCFDAAVLAAGHSARDVFYALERRGVMLERKPFAVGVRIEHSQSLIDRAMYGRSIPQLGAADYKLAAKTSDGRGCYTFCMCPGGFVSAAASEEGGVVTNGMSMRARDGKNANSALLVGVRPEDFAEGGALAGIEFQRKYERLAFEACGGFKAPAQNAADFADGVISTRFAARPSYPLGVTACDLKEFLPDFVVRGLKEGLLQFERRIKGFVGGGVMTGVETRSSSPVRVLRGEDGQSSLKGLFPCGEGAGYAGGITSAAADGIKTALNAVKKLRESV